MQTLKIDRGERLFPIKRNFADALFEWDEKFARLSLPGGAERHLSYRHGLGFVITRRRAMTENLTDRHLLFVADCDPEAARLTVSGAGEPPVTSLLHALIYRGRSGAIFIFQLVHEKIEQAAIRSGFPAVGAGGVAAEDGLLREFEGRLGSGNLVVVPREGVLSFGCTPADAGEPLLALHQRIAASA